MKTRTRLIPVQWFRLSILLIVFSGLCANSSFAQPITWMGSGVDTFSNNPASWSGGVLPTASSDVTIPDGAAPLYVNTSTTWASVTFIGGSQATRMTVGPSITLAVTGNITIQSATASRDVISFGILNCPAVIGGTNTSGSGNRITIFSGGTLTVPGDVTACNLVMFGSSTATLGGNFTGTASYAPVASLAPTIDFNSTDPQTMAAGTYANINFSGGGNKTTGGNITIGETATFSNGIVINSLPIFFDGSLGGTPAMSGASPTSFATGPVRWFRQGTAGAFTFPVGKSGAGYHPLVIDPLLVAGTDFTVEYIRSSGSALGPVTAPGIVSVSNCEYWTVNRTAGGAANVTLSWGATSGCRGTYITDLASLRVVHFNGTNWDQSGTTGGTGSASAGIVTFSGAANFSPFTIGTTSPLNPLPVELTEFSASRCGNNICLYWKTVSENNNDHFEIERSADGRLFIVVGGVTGNGTTSETHSYSFSDDQPLNGKNYYRIKQVNIDGKYYYSSILGVNNANVTSFSASITPNPAQSVLNLVIEGVKEKENLLFEVMNTNGMIVYRESISAGRTIMVKNLRRPAISAGLYFFKITRSSTNETSIGRLVLQ